ncbi:SDR family oxidoreductase [Rubellimicrobium roseum]|uniref:SDR family oxidoreductase n=1 Tax=Rubellimicrobium roseum TaxID=687525 RepID=A0A5C4N7X8_9RHOB|nr:SDR family oxidoreductase [Rubellimicrobium roseum]TNC63489.1 SDR family oxidoreductase [Rubellimicrobium roseum]
MGKVLLITGASSGIGAATARAAVQAGWTVGLVARSADRLATLVNELGPERAVALPADVTSVEAQTQAIDALVGRFGRLDAAFANAGLGASRPGAEQGDLDEWRQMLEVNIWGLLVTVRLALPHLRASQGHVVLTGSRAARTELSGSVYGATKHFVHGFAANLLAEMRPWGGRCTVVAPGMVDTPFFSDVKPGGLRAEDVAGAVIYALEQPAHVAVGEVYLMPVPGA